MTNHIDNATIKHIQRLNALGFKNKLVAAYIDLQMRREDIVTLQDILDEINTDLGLNYKIQRMMDWRNGARPCSKRVMEHMRRYVLQYLFADEDAEALMMLLTLER